MILADTSIWIEWLNKKGKAPEIEQFFKIAICPPVIQEILQGVHNEKAYCVLKERLLALPLIGVPVSIDLYLSAAEIYRLGKQKGYTIRSSMDCLIAAIAIENRLPIWHRDRDFDTISKFTALKIHS